VKNKTQLEFLRQVNWPRLLLIMAGIAILVPVVLAVLGVKGDGFGGYAAWFGDAIIAIAAIFAIQQLVVNKTTADTDTFLKICNIIDDEQTFGKNYEFIKTNADRMGKATLSAEGCLEFQGESGEGRLVDATMDVLYALEQVGILVAYTDIDRNMVNEYIGDVVIRAHDILLPIISAFQGRDRTMFQRFDEFYSYCSGSWEPKIVKHLPYTNVPKHPG